MAELKTFLFTDICGSVRLKGEMTGRSVTERDQAFVESILSPHRSKIEAKLTDMGGRVVSTAGDGHFLVFDNTIQAALWAADVQLSHRDTPIKTPAGAAVEVRISMHVGVPQVDPSDPNNFVGKSVDYASRLNDYATGGQILVSRSVMAILDDVGLEGIRLHLHGKKNLKGIGSVEVHELLYDEHGPRSLRNAPKSSTERQWTVLPTAFYEGGSVVTTAPGTALRRVGNYELEELLGAGGMGDVYKARHTQFGRVRAVKVIKPQFLAAGQSEMVRRFYNEIKAVGRLEHKNIVVAIDSSAPTDKVHYLVMEYIDGVGADELVSQLGALPIADACEIVRQAARGLQYIHKNDMVHRDLKPSNLMLTLIDGEQIHSDSTLTQTGDGERAVVKILDLGLALLASDGADRLTRLDHKAMGTGMYMSPEQWRTTSVDIRSDIYSLGCTLYHLLAGNPPFFDSDLRPEKAHEKSPPPPIRTGGAPLPKKLWDVLRKMLEKRPEDRYQTPAEVSAALAPFCEGNHLAALIRNHLTGTVTDAAAIETARDAHSQGDTWRSKSKISGAALAASRDWIRDRGLKTLAALAVVACVLWLFYASKQRFLAEKLRDAHRQLPSFARAAAGPDSNLSKELAKRFAMLIESAGDPDLIEALEEHNRDGAAPVADDRLDKWIARMSHKAGITVDSWFVNDAGGMQAARSPARDSLGQNFRTRDYFHGQGRDLSEEEAKEVRPIRQPHLSAVYMSQTTKKLKVAFSVPIWSLKKEQSAANPAAAETGATPPTGSAEQPGTSEPEVIGVLSMSVNVAEFEVLDADFAGGNQVALIDLREDTVDGEKRRGLILHHPQQDLGESKHVDDQLLKMLDDAEPLDPKFRSEDHFLQDFRDPFDDSPQRYWGAIQAVSFEMPHSPGGAAENEERPAWIVLVESPMPR
jgi:serine/threonine protein kinase/class 3 adenylate cyclase